MGREQVSIRTRDGDCPAHFFTPEGSGPWPAVIFYMDGLGIRPALLDMAAHLADGGYAVLLPDLFYRAGPYPPMDPDEVFASDNPRAVLAPLMETTDNRRASEDTGAFLDWLDSRAEVAGGRIGLTGYCMGGGMALTAAGTWPDRIAAAASFHGGNLDTESPMSPHLLAPEMKAFIYVAGADADKSYPPEMAERLERALTDADVRHCCEIYEGALHGWTMPDFPVYNRAAADRHWRVLFDMLDENLDRGA